MRTLDKSGWQPFFDQLTKSVEGQQVQIEVAGLGFGDQIQVDWVPLLGISYDDKDDVLTVSVADLEHMIHNPAAVEIDEAGGQVSQVAVLDDDGHTEIVRLKQPLALDS